MRMGTEKGFSVQRGILGPACGQKAIALYVLRMLSTACETMRRESKPRPGGLEPPTL
ncbi:MAG: hypothetical protein MI923_09850 [Phycisphaerales bacterium]|nr:hypothetical protein [Phycisphaerales bacterium]